MNTVYQARVTSGVIVGAQALTAVLLIRSQIGYGWNLNTIIIVSMLMISLGMVLYSTARMFLEGLESLLIESVWYFWVLIPYVLMISGYVPLAYFADVVIFVRLIDSTADTISTEESSLLNHQIVWRTLALPQFCLLALPLVALGVAFIHDLFRLFRF